MVVCPGCMGRAARTNNDGVRVLNASTNFRKFGRVVDGTSLEN